MSTLVDVDRVTAADRRRQPDARATAATSSMAVRRLNLMRGGYLLMGVGLAVTRWPQVPHAASLPLMNGIVLAMLTAMSVLAFVGLRYPVRMLPLLVFESAWKLLWLGVVGLPHVVAGDVSTELGQTLVGVLFVVVIVAVTPWAYAWRLLVTAPVDPWR